MSSVRRAGSRGSSLTFLVQARSARADPRWDRDGFLHALRRERVTREEVLQAARTQSHADLSGVAAVVLETDGSLSVLSDAPRLSTTG